MPTRFERVRDFERQPFRAGDRVATAALDVEVRAVDARGVPTRVRFT